jgi:cytochrome c peroxidase
MMLPTDMALVKDDKFRAWVKKYAADSELWFEDFSAGLVKLFELGVPFEKGSEKQRWVFKTLDESEAEVEVEAAKTS